MESPCVNRKSEPNRNAFQFCVELNLLTSVSSQLYPRCLRVREIFLLSLIIFTIGISNEIELILFRMSYYTGFVYSKAGNYDITK
jgi:hypothetical protein